MDNDYPYRLFKMSGGQKSGFSLILIALAVTLLLSCRTPQAPPAFRAGYLDNIAAVDGILDEAVYQMPFFTDNFTAVCRPAAVPPKTKAWLWWNERGLWFAFAAIDSKIIDGAPSANEHAVDAFDRVELFLWPENSARYFCVEIAPSGAVHDYSARYYRHFDDAWHPEGASFAARRTPEGYSVEGFLPFKALRKMGFQRWQQGTVFRLGLFRADFGPGNPADPLWLSWIDPQLPQADFHVSGAFAPTILQR